MVSHHLKRSSVHIMRGCTNWVHLHVAVTIICCFCFVFVLFRLQLRTNVVHRLPQCLAQMRRPREQGQQLLLSIAAFPCSMPSKLSSAIGNVRLQLRTKRTRGRLYHNGPRELSRQELADRVCCLSLRHCS